MEDELLEEVAVDAEAKVQFESFETRSRLFPEVAQSTAVKMLQDR